MAKARSPSYPAIGLKEAIEKVRAVYAADYQNPIPRKVAAQHMGYASLNGKSLGVLSALIKYGLLEGRGDDTRVSDTAVTMIAHPSGAPERVEALRLAAQQPDLFGELDTRFNGGKASDQAIRSYLLTQKFIPAAADAAIRSYRETKQLVSGESSGYGDDQVPDEPAAPETLEPRHYRVRAEMGKYTLTGQEAALRVTPMRVSFDGEALAVNARLGDAEAVDRLIRALEANKPLLPDKPPDEPASN